jgi:hypothetical protein
MIDDDGTGAFVFGFDVASLKYKNCEQDGGAFCERCSFAARAVSHGSCTAQHKLM